MRDQRLTISSAYKPASAVRSSGADMGRTVAGQPRPSAEGFETIAIMLSAAGKTDVSFLVVQTSGMGHSVMANTLTVKG